MSFERVTPESLGIRSEDIVEFLDREFKAGIQLHSFMLIRHGKVAAEGWYDPYSPDEKHIIYSFSKTFTATAIGFARQEGILSLDEKLVDLFPDELPDTVSENLALADIESLLTMSCGHAEEITTEDIEKSGGNWVKAFLAKEFKFRPHTMFQYNTPGTDLLCVILKKKTGQSLTQFLTPRLFEPLGITDYYCSKTGDRTVEAGSPYSEIEAGGWGFHMLTEDLAKFIWFLAQRGVWDGKRLLEEEWFDRAFRKQIETLNDVYAPAKSNWKMGYCYQCWCNPTPGSWRADGAYGQFGYVLPDKDAVMIMTAGAVDTETQLNLYTETIADRMSEEPLPENPAEYQKLQEKLNNLRIPGLWAVRQPWSEELIEGKQYEIDNPSGISFEKFTGGEGHYVHSLLVLEKMSFSFRDNQLIITLTERGQNSIIEQVLNIGLDGDYRRSQLSDGLYFSSGRWVWADEMELEIRFHEALGAAMIRLNIDESSVKLTVRNQMPEEIDLTSRPLHTLSGKCHVM